MADISPIQTIFLSSFVGALVSYLGAWLKSALEMRSKIDEELLHKRTELYKDLWDKTRILPKWPREDNVSYEKLISFSTELREWYFNGGGLYLSRSAQRAYARVQDAICPLSSKRCFSFFGLLLLLLFFFFSFGFN